MNNCYNYYNVFCYYSCDFLHDADFIDYTDCYNSYYYISMIIIMIFIISYNKYLLDI